MFYEVNEIRGKIADLRAMSGHWYRDLRDAEFYDDGEEAAYDDADSLYWETAEARGWV